MNYKVLQRLLQVMAKEQKCPRCARGFVEECVDIVALFEDRALFSLRCSCSSSLVVMVSQSVPLFGLPAIKTHTTKALTTDEFLAMKNELKQFKGGFSTLFN